MPFIINLNVSTMKGYLMELSAMGKSRLGGLPSIIISLIRSLMDKDSRQFRGMMMLFQKWITKLSMNILLIKKTMELSISSQIEPQE